MDRYTITPKEVFLEGLKALLLLAILALFVILLFSLEGCITAERLKQPTCPPGQAGHWEHGTHWICEPIPSKGGEKNCLLSFRRRGWVRF